MTAGPGGRTWVAVLLVLSLLAGFWAFHAARYGGHTLVVHARTFSTGVGTVLAEDENDRQIRRQFAIGSDDGETAFYVVELPRSRLQSLQLLPLGEPGRFDISRLSLASGQADYFWDENMVCQQQLRSEKLWQRVACGSSAPVLSVHEDGSVQLTAIPAEGQENGDLFRFCLALAAAAATLLGGLFLLPLFPAAGPDWIAGGILTRAAWLAVLCLYLYQYYQLAVYAVDLPFYEEWEFFEPDALQRGLTLPWLFVHFGTNQQVVVFTKLMAWLDYQLFGLDFVKLKLMNYAVFGLYLAALVAFARRVAGDGFRLLPAFLIFLLSPLAYEAHAASFQSGEIFVLLFSMGMLSFTLTDRPGFRDATLFAVCALGAIFSMHTGVVIAAILLAGRTVFIVVARRKGTIAKRAATGSLLITWGITLSGIIFWLAGFNRSAGETVQRLLPVTGRFWDQFLNLLSFGFGFDSTTPLPGAVILLFLLAPVTLLLINTASRWEKSTWLILQAILILLALAAMITFGRGAMFATLKLSRYTVYLAPLIPFGAIAWWLLLKGRRELPMVLAAYWLFCFAAFANNWDYGVYRDLREMDMLNLECVDKYTKGSGDGNCPGSHGVPIGGFFDNARRLDISFTRQFSPRQPK